MSAKRRSGERYWPPLEERFWAKVSKETLAPPDYSNLKTPCQLWIGSTTKGYGAISVNGKTKRVHILSWEWANGQSVPKGKQVCHHCDRPACITPDHLFLGTNQDNVDDKIAKGRQYRPPTPATCPYGHPYNAENTYILKDGRKNCRICRNEQNRIRRSKQ